MNTFHFVNITILTLAAIGLSTFFMCILFKYHIPKAYDMTRPKWLPPICIFCLCFWSGFIAIVILKIELKEPMTILELIICALIAAPITRRLISDL